MARWGRAFPIRPHQGGPVTTATLPFHYYHTSFPLAESPISEGHVWVNGAADGGYWCNVNTTAGKAFGTQTGNNTTTTIGVSPNEFDDATAILKGTFLADQSGKATVFSTGSAGDYSREVEIRLRSSITSHSNTGYEVEYSCDPSNPYFDIVRWNGQVGDFTPLTLSTGGTHLASMPGGAAVTGDVLEARVIGSTIYGFKNGVLMASATDTTYTSGNPGMGYYLHNRTGTGDPTTYGFSDYTARSLNARDWRQTFAFQAVNRGATY